MKRIIVILFSTLMLAVSVLAQSQTIILKDGSEYKGYISNQIFEGNGKVEITFSEFTGNIKISDIHFEEPVKKNYDDLSPEWQSWAEKNGKLVTEKGKRYLNMVDMALPGLSKREYVILERGTKYIKCYTMSEGVVECAMDQVHCLLRENRNPLLLTDLDDVVKTETNTFTGVIIEQYPGIQIKVWDRYDGEVHIVNYNEIRSIGKAGFNPDYDIWTQAPYLEQLRLDNGVVSEPGIILENGMTGDINLVFMTSGDKGVQTRQYSYNSIKGILKKQNEEYEPEYDIILPEGESRINRDSTLAFADISEYQYVGPFQLYYLDNAKDSLKTVINTPKVCIETSTSGISDIYVFKATKRKATANKGKEELELYTYTYADLFESDIEVDKSTTINGTTRLKFDLPEEGDYFVYLRKLDKCWFFSYYEKPENNDTM